ncbi:MAG: glycosyltransferase family 2 protein [Nitrospirae bacterium]|nr:glycosyltransferase family 2 protein [Nitrospirota bacterium]
MTNKELNQNMIDLKNEKVSIIIPIYNSEKYIEECLQSIKNQQDNNYEVILVDDGSKDASCDIYNKFSYLTIRLPVNKGQAVARNKGVEKAAGNIICFVDSDVVVPSDWLTKYRNLLAKYPEASMICSGYNKSKGSSPPELFALYESQYRREQLPLYINGATTSNSVIYKSDFNDTGGFTEYYLNWDNYEEKRAVVASEDGELGYRLSKKGKKIVWSHENQVQHAFKDNWKDYLVQQKGFSRDAVLSYFRYPERITAKNIYSGEKIFSQLIIIIGMIISLLPSIFEKKMILVTLILEIMLIYSFYLVNKRFIIYLRKKMKDYKFIKVLFWLFITRIVWIFGILLGIRDGLIMKFNEIVNKGNQL